MTEEIKKMTEFMAETRRDIEYIREKLDNVPTIDSMKLANKKLVEDIFCEANERYASKTSERVVYTLVGAVLLYVLNNMLSMI